MDRSPSVGQASIEGPKRGLGAAEIHGGHAQDPRGAVDGPTPGRGQGLGEEPVQGT